MPDWSPTWTFFDGTWHEGNVPLWGARTHAIWLGSSVFDGARVFEGVAPDVDLHCARVNGSAQAMFLKPTVSVEEWVALVREGMKKFAPRATLYVRPMYWAERAGPLALPPDPESTRFALTLYEAPMRKPDGFSITLSPFRRRDRAGRGQGGLPLSEQRARDAGSEVARLRQLPHVRRGRQCRRACQFQRLHGPRRNRVHADPERHVPRRDHAAPRHRAPARIGRGGRRDGAALPGLRNRRRDLLDRQCLQGPAGHPHRRTLAAARPLLPQGARALLGIRARRRLSLEPTAPRPGPSGLSEAEQRPHEIERHRKDDGRGLVAGDVLQRGEIAQLHRLGLSRQHFAGLHELLGRLLLGFRADDAGTAVAFGLGLPGDGADHALVDVDVLDLDIGDLDAPGVGLRVEDLLDVVVELVALGEHLVELVLAEHGTQRGLRELAGGGEKILDLDDRLVGVDDAEIDHRIDLDRDVVARDHVLARHVVHDGAQ